jgi:hypothetical protein
MSMSLRAGMEGDKPVLRLWWALEGQIDVGAEGQGMDSMVGASQ